MRVIGLVGLFMVLGLAACGRSDVPSSGAPGGPPAGGSQKLTVAVVVVDSLMPDEITAATPSLNQLKTEGTFYAESRSVFVAETIPNHVAMMTGVYPLRSGVANNNIFDYLSTPAAEHDSSIPEELTANTLFTWLRRQCVDSGVNPELRSSAALSKKYLFDAFAGDAVDAVRANRNPAVFNLPPDRHWDPRDSPAYIPAPDEHTPDVETMQEALAQLPGADFIFINLGDVDRSAHASGPGTRTAVLSATDTQVGLLVDELQSSGRWDNTVLFLVSDHGMDYSIPVNVINLQPLLNAYAGCGLPAMTAIDNGGTDSIYFNDPATPLALRQSALRTLRSCVLGTTPCATACPAASRPMNAAQVAFAWYSQPDAADPSGTLPANVQSGHPNLGGLVLVANAGYRFSESSQTSNPIPGNHGHAVTLHNTFIVSGGSPWVKKGQVIAPSSSEFSLFDRLPEQSENIDVAPTVAWLMGLGLRNQDFPDFAQTGGGFDGRILKEAFTQFDTNASAASPSLCGRFD